MFSFICKFFEKRREKAAERNRLCSDLFQRVTKALVNYVDVDKCTIESLRKWILDNRNLIDELNDIDKFKKASDYRLLVLQNKSFKKIQVEAESAIQTIIANEKRKSDDAEYVKRKLNQWVSEQKHKKVNISKLNALNQKLVKSAGDFAKQISENPSCPCRSKDGKKKTLYLTEIEALAVAEYRSKIIKSPLRVYWCPYGGGFHITSNCI